VPAVRESPLWVKAEMRIAKDDVCFTPESRHQYARRICLLRAKSRHLPQLLDQFVGAANQIKRNVDPERLRGFEVDQQFDFGGLEDRQFSRFFAL